MKKIFKAIREKEQGNKFVTKYNIHVITRKDIKQKMQKSVQSDVVIPNKLGNGETCQGLLRRFVHKIPNNNKISPHNDMDNKNRNELINLFTYRLIDFKRDSSPNALALNGYGFALMLELVRLRMTAFTLAEVLITLGIIGIVAAMTIPTLITNYQKKQTVTKLQKAISVLNQAYRLAYDDVGEATAEEAHSMGAKAYYNKYWAPYIKTSFVCQENTFCGYDRNQPFYAIGGTKEYPLAVKTSDSRVAFQTLDGFFYMVITYTGEGDTSAKTIVDINGPEKPNIFGRDVFLLDRKEDGEKGGVVVPYCSNRSTSDVIANCTQDSSGDKYLGECCAERIRRAGWEIDKTYPWN